jgi:hypothetical protein
LTRPRLSIRYVNPAPLLDAARNGRPRHQPDCSHCHGRSGPGGHQPSFTAHCVTDQDLADLLNVDVRQIQRWLTGTRIQADTNRLDQYATAAGSHPLILWPELNTIWGQV